MWADPYSGKVSLKDETSTTGTGLEGAKVVFNDGTKDVEEVNTTNDGTFSFTKVPEGTAGTITVKYAPSGSTEIYSKDKYTTTSATKSTDLQNFEIRKLTSLQVKISDGTSSSTTDRNSCWCPVIADDKALADTAIKFYDYDGFLIKSDRGDGKSGSYSMKDIASTTKTSAASGEAYKSQANYFA